MVLADAFYRYYAINSNTVNSWHNYALSRALAFTDFARASKAFYNALSLDPTNSLVLNNFNIFRREYNLEGTNTLCL